MARLIHIRAITRRGHKCGSCFGVKVVKHGNEHGFRSAWQFRGAVLQRSVMTDDNVQKNPQCVGWNWRFLRGRRGHGLQPNRAAHNMSNQIAVCCVGETALPFQLDCLDFESAEPIEIGVVLFHGFFYLSDECFYVLIPSD